MIALDTSSLVAYLDGSTGKDVLAVDLALEQHQAVLPPVVLCELLSAPRLPRRARTQSSSRRPRPPWTPSHRLARP